AHSGRMANLTVLNLSSKKLNGSIPATMGSMTSLKHLYLQSSFLSSSLPSTLGGLSALVDLVLSGNSLQGTIPNTFSQLTNLEQLVLWINEIAGTLLDMANMTSLTTLSLEYNGSNPAAIGDLSLLTVLYTPPSTPHALCAMHHGPTCL
ncbi:unnamed protein product, partial [Closterium sp. Naga37s-1]